MILHIVRSAYLNQSPYSSKEQTVRIDAGGTAQSIPAMEKRWRASRALWTLGKSSETTPAHWGSFAQSTQESIRKSESTGQLTWGSFAQSTQEVESGELPQAGNYIYKSYQHPDASPQNSGTKPTLPASSLVPQLAEALELPMLQRLSNNRCT